MFKEYSYWIVPIFQNLDWELQVLLIQNKWWWHRWFPKWHQEQWETPLQTAIRELQEETWLQIDKIQWQNILTEKYIDYYTFQTQWKKIYKQVWYFIWYVQSQKVQIQQDEIINYQRIDINQAQDQLTHDWSKNILQQIKQTIQNSKANI